MGVSGVMFGGFLKDAKQSSVEQRFLHNQRVLKAAKQALLSYAYNYPVTVAGRGPGRLPCPDTDNSTTANSTGNCLNIGRFPFNAAGMNFYDARDASGERLWYAVSSAFAYNISPADNDVINISTKRCGPGSFNYQRGGCTLRHHRRYRPGYYRPGQLSRYLRCPR